MSQGEALAGPIDLGHLAPVKALEWRPARQIAYRLEKSQTGNHRRLSEKHSRQVGGGGSTLKCRRLQKQSSTAEEIGERHRFHKDRLQIFQRRGRVRFPELATDDPLERTPEA